MTARHLVTAATVAVSLAALTARVLAGMLDAAVRELGNYRTEIPDVIPLWMDEEADLP